MYEEAFTSGEHEAWVFRGGLQSEFQVCILGHSQDCIDVAFFYRDGCLACWGRGCFNSQFVVIEAINFSSTVVSVHHTRMPFVPCRAANLDACNTAL